ncbi:hypothetical protein ES705_45615 [subsurface metagenome]
MAKESGRAGAGSKSLPGTPSSKVKEHSEPTGSGGTEIWVNDRGETCIGNKCFSLAYREDEDDITVRIDRNECDEDMLPIVESISQALGKGGRTLWETISLRKK